MKSGNPFGYMFQDRDWFVRFLATMGFFILTAIIMFIVLLTVLIPVTVSTFQFTDPGGVIPTSFDPTALFLTFLVLTAAGIIVGGIVYGYLLQVVDNIIQGVATPLPKWTENFGRRTWHGILFGVISFIWSLPSTILSVIDSGQSFALMQPGVNRGVSILGLLGFLYSLFFILILPVIIGRFAVSRRFGDAFRLGDIFSTFTRNIGKYLLAFLLEIAAGIAAVILGLIATIGVIPVFLAGRDVNFGLAIFGFLVIIFVFLLIGTYFYYVFAGIYGFANRDLVERESPHLPPESGISI